MWFLIPGYNPPYSLNSRTRTHTSNPGLLVLSIYDKNSAMHATITWWQIIISLDITFLQITIQNEKMWQQPPGPVAFYWETCFSCYKIDELCSEESAIIFHHELNEQCCFLCSSLLSCVLFFLFYSQPLYAKIDTTSPFCPIFGKSSATAGELRLLPQTYRLMCLSRDTLSVWKSHYFSILKCAQCCITVNWLQRCGRDSNPFIPHDIELLYCCSLFVCENQQNHICCSHFFVFSHSEWLI